MASSKKGNLFIIFMLFIVLGWILFWYFKYYKWESLMMVDNKVDKVVFNKFQSLTWWIIRSNIVNFPVEIDRKSFEENVQIFPEVKPNYIWADNRSVEIKIKSEIENDTEFYVNVPQTVIDKEWNTLDKAIIQQFKVGWVARLDFITPDWEISDLTKNITVRFNKPMIALTTFDNQPDCPIVITPKIEGKCVWVTTSTFQFRPSEGFPIWWKYKISIPKWIKSVLWKETINWKDIEITTPKFKILHNPSTWYKDKPLFIIFNDDIFLENFIDNFEIEWIEVDDLDIEYLKIDSDVEWKKIDNKKVISIFPKNKDWGYWKNYNYILNSWLKSIRWNVVVWKKTRSNFKIEKLLLWYYPIMFIDDSIEDIELSSNLRKSNNYNIVNRVSPKVLLSFYEDMTLDKWLFSVTIDDLEEPSFSLSYQNKVEYIDWEKIISEDKKNIIIEFGQNVNKTLSLKINTSEISVSEDEILKFTTKEYNDVVDLKFINYKQICLIFKNDIWYIYSNNDKILFNWDAWKIRNISNVSRYSNYIGCEYEEWKYKFILNTRLDPTTDYNIFINNSLIDVDNYPLKESFESSFITLEAMNEDKSFSIVDNRNFILVPKNISPLWVAIKTVNLDKVSVTICEWDFDVKSIDLLKNENCITKEVWINNLWFTTNFSVLNLEEIYGNNFTKSLVSLKVDKLGIDKTKDEIANKYGYYNSKAINYLRTNTSLVFKVNNDTDLWLSDFTTWELLTDAISKVELYKSRNSYDSYGKNQWRKNVFNRNIDFEAKKDWLYELEWKLDWYVLVTLKAWEQILFNVGSSYSRSPWNKAYITTDRSIYKPWDTVKINWILRKQTAINYELISWWQALKIMDSRYKNIVDDTFDLGDNSSIDYELELDENAPLWNYSIAFWYNSLWFAVEEYEKPDFKVESKSSKDVYLYWENPEVEISAEYYIWSWLSNWEWNYNVMARDYNFDWGITSWYSWWENSSYWRGWYNNYSLNSKRIIYDTLFNLDSNWKSVISIDTTKTISNKVYDISSTVIDSNTKKSISSNASFKILNSPVFVWMKYNKYYYDFWDTVKLDFVSVDFEWKKVWDKNLSFKVYKVNYEYDKDTYITTKDEVLLLEKKVLTDSNWISNIDYKVDDYWEFRFEIELDNKKYKTTKTIYVSGFNLLKPKEQEHNLNIITNKNKYNVWETSEIIIQSPISNVKALLTVEKLDKVLYKEVIDIESNSQIYNLAIKKEYLPNFELKVFIIKPSNSSLLTTHKLKQIRVKLLKLEQELYWNKKDVSIPLYVSYDILYKWGFIPYMGDDTELSKELLLEISELRANEQKLMQELIPTYFSWKVPVKISLDTVKLNAKIKTDKDNYLPSDSTTIELDIVDSSWKPVNWDAVISVVDESLLALKNNDKNILDFFYGDTSNYINTYFNLRDLIKRFEFNESINENKYESDKNDYREYSVLKRWGWWWGLSVMSAWASIASDSFSVESASAPTSVSDSESNSSSSTNSTKLRTEFKDLAYYNSKVKVVNWKAKVNIDKLPDNLTTWVVKWFVITKDTEVWNFESKFKVKKILNLIPSIPRFFVSWDVLEITAVVINNSDKDIDIESSIEINNVEVLDKPKDVKISAKWKELLVWKVKVDGMKNDIDWNGYFSDITIMVKSWDLIDSMKVSKKIIPYSTPEYTFTNGSTYGLSYEEKINLPDYVDQSQGQLDISYGATILTSLLDNVENLASMPLDNFYSTVYALKKWAILKWIYEKAWRLEKFKKIEVYDYNWIVRKLDDVLNDRIKYLNNYQTRDWWMKTYSDCISQYRVRVCENFDLTWDFLEMAKVMNENWFRIDKKLINSALVYYKKELQKKIQEYEREWSTYRNINSFYKIIWYDKEFLNKYILSDRFSDKSYKFDNISKLKIILLLQDIDKENELISIYMKELRNKTIIEARWTFVPAHSYNWKNIISSSLALRVFINDVEVEKLIIENLARWLMAQKREDWNFGSSYDSSEVLKAITDYIVYTKELENVDFEAKWYLNYREVTSEIFNDKNKFSLKQESFKLKDTIKFWEDNSLGFEKVWTWKLYYDVWLRYFLPIEKIEARDEWIIVSRSYYDYKEYKNNFKEVCIDYWLYFNTRSYYGSYNYCNTLKLKNLESLSSWNKWDMLIWEIEIIVPSERNNVIVNNFIPAWAEILNGNLDTTSSDIKNISWSSNSNWYSWFSHIDIKNDRVLLYADHLYKWSYKYTYVIRLNHKWEYHHRPAFAEELKKPEVWWRSRWEIFEVK